MKHRRLLGIPVDDRPVTGEQVQDLVAIRGWQLDLPPKEWRGHFREPGACDAMAAWLLDESDRADGVVISLDMFLYGGLVASRYQVIPNALLAQRFAILHQLKERHPHLMVYAFSATMRISNNNVAEEEKAYWATHGKAIWEWSYREDEAQVTGGDEALARAARAAVPADIRADYLATRDRNFAWTLAAIAAVAEGWIDRLILPQDDTAEYGFNIAERRRLEHHVRERGLSARVLIYPGADEVMHTLCAHLIAYLCHDAPRHALVLASDPKGIAQLRARYEDRPILASLACQAQAVGMTLHDSAARSSPADVLIAVHTQGTAQGDWALQQPLPEPHVISPAWLDAIDAALARGQPVVVLDLAFANGGDPQLIGALARRRRLSQLNAYAGWNTASNSIGSALAQWVLTPADSPRTCRQRRALAQRLLEDYVFQAVVRQVVRAGYPSEGNAMPSATLEALVAAAFTAHANAFSASQGLGVRVTEVWLPWGRTFEIGFAMEDVDTSDGLDPPALTPSPII